MLEQNRRAGPQGADSPGAGLTHLAPYLPTISRALIMNVDFIRSIRALTIAALPWCAACSSTAPVVVPEDVAVRTADDALLIVGNTEPVARILVRNGEPLLVQQLMARGARNILRPDLKDGARPVPPGTTLDHPHQRGIRVAHGDVNGHHLWEERGTIEVVSHTLDLPLAGGARVDAMLEWRAPNGDLLCTENRAVTVRPFTDRRELDVEITLSATGDGVTFGDEKDGLLGLRLADPFQLGRSGTALDSEGRQDHELWGKSARWVAYSAPLADRKGEEADVTVAFFDHPDNPRYPTRWHARPYGLVAANPFGLSAFDGDSGRRGDLRLASYESIDFKYRIIVTAESMDAASIEGWCSEFTGLPLVEIEPEPEAEPEVEPEAEPEVEAEPKAPKDTEEEPSEAPPEDDPAGDPDALESPPSGSTPAAGEPEGSPPE